VGGGVWGGGRDAEDWQVFDGEAWEEGDLLIEEALDPDMLQSGCVYMCVLCVCICACLRVCVRVCV